MNNKLKIAIVSSSIILVSLLNPISSSFSLSKNKEFHSHKFSLIETTSDSYVIRKRVNSDQINEPKVKLIQRRNNQGQNNVRVRVPYVILGLGAIIHFIYRYFFLFLFIGIAWWFLDRKISDRIDREEFAKQPLPEENFAESEEDGFTPLNKEEQSYSSSQNSAESEAKIESPSLENVPELGTKIEPQPPENSDELEAKIESQLPENSSELDEETQEQPPVANVKEGWNHYTTIHDFSLQIPPEWDYDEEKSNDNYFLFQKNGNELKSSHNLIKTEIRFYPESMTEILAKMKDELIENEIFTMNEGKIKIGEKQAIRLWNQLNNDPNFTHSFYSIIKFTEDSSVLLLSYYHKINKEALKELQEFHINCLIV